MWLQASRIAHKAVVQRRKIPHFSQTTNPAEQELELPVCCTRDILRDLMSGHIHRHPGQTSLRMRHAHIPSTGLETHGRGGDGLVFRLVDDLVDQWVVWNKEEIAWCLGETLCAVPGHIIQCHEGAVGQEEIVEQTAADDDVVGAFDDGWEG